MLRHFFVALLVAFSAPLAAQTPACSSRLFVSSYFTTVHVYDACTGAYLRNLDTNTRLRGPQAVKLGPDGLLYVISEMTQQILRYRNDTLEYVDVFATFAGIDPTGFAFAPNGDVYVAGFRTDDVRRLSSTGAVLGDRGGATDRGPRRARTTASPSDPTATCTSPATTRTT